MKDGVPTDLSRLRDELRASARAIEMEKERARATEAGYAQIARDLELLRRVVKGGA
jgi:hypothetical protein